MAVIQLESARAWLFHHFLTDNRSPLSKEDLKTILDDVGDLMQGVAEDSTLREFFRLNQIQDTPKMKVDLSSYDSRIRPILVEKVMAIFAKKVFDNVVLTQIRKFLEGKLTVEESEAFASSLSAPLKNRMCAANFLLGTRIPEVLVKGLFVHYAFDDITKIAIPLDPRTIDREGMALPMRNCSFSHPVELMLFTMLAYMRKA